MFRRKTTILGVVIAIVILGNFSFVQAIDVGVTQDFYVESQYDLYSRSRLSATLQEITNPFYLYTDNNWWNSLSYGQRVDIKNKFYNLSNEFERKIYPQLKSNWGEENRPGIDGDIRVVVLVHPMKAGIGGYFRSKDGYFRSQVTDSNQKEMIYFSSDRMEKVPLEHLYYYLAHEFTHLITFNQKDIRYDVSEDTWLNEARAEYTETLLGYDKIFSGSNLEQRIRDFITKPTTEIIQWDNDIYDYARVNLFIHYLVDHYGINILKDSLHSPCGLGKEYCYSDPHLQNFTILPYTYYLSSSGKSFLSVTNSLFPWTASWQRIIGGKDNLRFKIDIPEETPIQKIPYIVVHADNKKELKFIYFTRVNEQVIHVPDFGKDKTADFGENKTSFIFIPSLVSGTQGKRYYYSWDVSTVEKIPNDNSSSQISAEVLQSLWDQLMEIQKQINYIRQEISLFLV